MTPEGVLAMITTVAGGMFGVWQWLEKAQAQRRKEDAEREAGREKAEREAIEFAFAKLQGIITELQQTNDRAIQKLDVAEARHQEARAEHAKCREQLVALEQKAEWQGKEIDRLGRRVARLESPK